MAEFLIKFIAISELAGKTQQFTTYVFCDNKLANEFTIRKRIRKSFSLQMNRLLVSSVYMWMHQLSVLVRELAKKLS